MVEKNSIVKYVTTGGDIELSKEIIKSQLVPPDSKITDQEVAFFLQMCKFQRLNPFLREIYIVKYGDYPAAFVVGKDTFLRRAKKNEDYLGHTVAIADDGQKAWAEVHVKNLKQPIRVEVELEEYIGTKSDGSVNAMWTKKPKTMLKKVALVQALREAFPQDLGGLYDKDEMKDQEEELIDVEASVVKEAETVSSTTEKPGEKQELTPESTQSAASKQSDDKGPGTSGEVFEIISKIKNVTQSTGGDPLKPWTRYNILTKGGTTFTTFNKKYAELAETIKGKDKEATLYYVVVNKSGVDYFNLIEKAGFKIKA